MRIFPILALSLVSAGLRADLLTQEFTINTYSVNKQGTEFNYLNSNDYLVPMTFELTFDLDSKNSIFNSRIDMEDDSFRYVSTNTQFDTTSFTYDYDSILLDEMMSYHYPSAIESKLYFTDIIFDHKPDGQTDMVENGANIYVRAATVTESMITGDPNSGSYTEMHKTYSTSFSFSAHNYFDKLDAEEPTVHTLTRFTDFLTNNPVEMSLGIGGMTRIVEYQNHQTIGEFIFDRSNLNIHGEATLSRQYRTKDVVNVNSPTSLLLFSISLLALGYRRFIAR